MFCLRRWTTGCVVLACLAWTSAALAAPAGLDLLAAKDAPLAKGERIAFLGDSITQQGAGAGGYARLIGEVLSKAHPDLELSVIYAGISGNRVPDLLRRLDRDVISKRPTIVFVYIGINDVWHSLQGRGTPKDQYAAGLRELLGKIRAAGAKVVLATPSVIGEKTEGNPLDPMLDAYAAVSRDVGRRAGARLCDLREQFITHLKQHNPDNKDRGILTTDGVHLNAAGNRFVADRVAECLVAALRAPAQAADQLDRAPSGAPRVNLAPWYQADLAWPLAVPGSERGAVPSIWVDPLDMVWVFTRGKPPVQVYDRKGKLVRSWGEGMFKAPHSIRLDGKNVWLVDAGLHAIFQCTPEGRVLKTFGTPGEPGCDGTHFNKPTDVTITPQGELFVADGYGNTRIAHFDAQGKFVKQWGSPGVGPGQFSLPHSIVVDRQGRLYVADRSNARIQVFDQEGKFLDQWLGVVVPWTLWMGKDGGVWVCGSTPQPWRVEDELLGCPPKDQAIMKFSAEGKLLELWTIPKGEDGKEKPGEVNWIHGIALDSQGNLYAGDIKGQRVQRFLRMK